MSVTRTVLYLGDELAADRPPSPEVYRVAGGDGPRVAILGGVHGDEPEGVLAAQRLLNRVGALAAADRLTGSVTVVPVANPVARALRTREGDSGQNLAREFPGRADGTLTERIAWGLTETVIQGADLLIDLHSAGRHYRMPELIGLRAGSSVRGTDLEELALGCGLGTVWLHQGVEPGRSVSAADELGVPWCYCETGGAGALRAADVDRYVAAVEHLLTGIGAVVGPATTPSGIAAPISGSIPAPGPEVAPRVVTDGSGDTDTGVLAGAAGRFVQRVAAGDEVTAGALLGELVDEEGRVRQRVTAPVSGPVMMLRHTTEVTAGDVLAIVVRGGGRP